MDIIAFISYILITSITPGPSNLLMMNEARRFGFKGAMRFNLGIMTGFMILGIISALFTSLLYQFIPTLEPWFKVAGAVYLLYLAWHIAFPGQHATTDEPVQSSFMSGLIFQLINVKSVLYFLTVMSAFILPVTQQLSAISFYLMLAIVLGWVCLLLWSAFGSIFKELFDRYDLAFRIMMVGLLLYSVVTLFH